LPSRDERGRPGREEPTFNKLDVYIEFQTTPVPENAGKCPIRKEAIDLRKDLNSEAMMMLQGHNILSRSHP
jgi:hypothetical protein